MRKKYLVIGDYVTSENDGERHYINCRELIRLYGVDPKECLTYESNSPSIVPTNGLFILAPLRKGNYKEYLKLLLSK